MRQAAKIAAFKHAGSMLPGASSGGNALVDSFPMPQSNVAESAYNMYDPNRPMSIAPLTDAEIAAANPRKFTWADAFTTSAPDPVFGSQKASPNFKLQPKDTFAGELTRGVASLGQLSDRYLGTNTGFDPAAIDDLAIADAQRRIDNSTPAKVMRGAATGAANVVDDLTDNDGGVGKAVGGLVERNITGKSTPATQTAAISAPESAPATAPVADTKGILGADNAMLHGLGGAGVGALLASALGDKKKRGRNALLGAGLGGGAGLLLNHLMNNKKAAMKEKQAEGGMPSDGMKNVAETIARAQGGLEGQVAGIGLGGLGGALLGAAHGAYSPGATASLDAAGNPTLKRRSRLMGALRGALGGGAGGALAGNFVGHHVGQYMGQQAAVNAQKTANSFLDQLQLNNPLVQNAGIAGGLGGAALGGLAGLVSPGEEESVDEFGRPVRRQRGRFGAMLRGALGGGAAGALGGYAAGRFAPGATGQALNAASSFGTDMAKRLGFGQQQPKPLNTANPQTLEEMMAADAQSRSKAPRSYRPLPGAGNYNTNMF
jgi:hypothetical protein